jgi:hypothetical protein
VPLKLGSELLREVQDLAAKQSYGTIRVVDPLAE